MALTIEIIMGKRKLYIKRPKYYVTAVQLDLEFDTFEYHKWGGIQKSQPGDWLVNNGGDTYTVAKDYFRDNYQKISPGVFNKTGEIWAEIADENGSIKTIEGFSDYKKGDYLVFDCEEGGEGEGYAIKKQLFERMYVELRAEPKLTDEQQAYINNRLLSKIEFFKTKSKNNQIQYYIWQTLAIVSAASVPVLSGFMDDNTLVLRWLVAILGGTSAVVAGLISLYKFQENWIRYKNTYQDLDSQLTQYKIGAGLYEDRKLAFSELVSTCENILNAEMGKWGESKIKNKEDED